MTFILYCLVMSIMFAGTYMGMTYIRYNRCGYRFDTMTPVMLSVFWPFTIWFVVPYLAIEIYKINKK